MSTNLTKCLVQYFSGKLYLSRFQKSSKYFLNNQSICTTIGYDNNPQFDYHEIKTYKEYIDERQINVGKIVTTLMNSLNVSKVKALNIITEWDALRTMTKTQIIDNINLLHEEDIDKSIIRDNAYILADSTDIIKQKIDIFKDANLEINSIIPLFRLPFSKIRIYGKRSKIDKPIIPDYKNRIHYLSSQLETDMNYLCKKIVMHPFILHVKMEKIIKVTKFLIGSDIQKYHIIEDLVVYKYAINTIQQRIMRAKKANMNPLRPWVVRCHLDCTLNAEVRSFYEQKYFQSCKNLDEYISQIMECDIELVNGILRRNPAIYSINLKKLTTLLTLLKNCGYTGTEMFYVSRIFFCRIDSLIKKYNLWKDHGLDKPPLFLLILPEATFNEHLEKALQNRILPES